MENCLSAREMNFIKFLKSKIETDPGIIHNGLKYFSLTRKDISQILECSVRTVYNLIKKLVEINVLLKEELSPNKMNRTTSFTLNPCIACSKVAASKRQIAACDFSGVSEAVYIRNTPARAKNNNIIINNINNKINNARARDDDFSKANEGTITSLKERPTTIQEMLKIWYEEFPNKPVKLTRQICGYMLGTFRLKFNNSLENWRQYLLKIKSSAYLMSEKFQIKILNLLKFSFIAKIFNNLLGTKETQREKPREELAKQAEEQISSLSESPKCKEIRRKIVQRHGAEWYLSWFREVWLKDEPSGEVIISSPSSFTIDWICNHTQVCDFTKARSIA
jgi:hypothetical protein